MHAESSVKKNPAAPARMAVIEYVGWVLPLGLWLHTKRPDLVKNTDARFRFLFERILFPYLEFLDKHIFPEDHGHSLNAAFDQVDFEPEHILDLGSGSGITARRLKTRFPSARVSSVDSSERFAELARKLAAEKNLEIEFDVGQFSELPYADDTFDLVVQGNAWPHIPELLRVMKPGGMALITYSYGGPWAARAWKTVEKDLRARGVTETDAQRTRPGFWGKLVKPGAR